MPSAEVVVCITLLYACIELSFGVASTVIAGANSDAKDECGPAVWYALLFVGITHLLGLVAMVLTIFDRTRKNHIANLLIVATDIWCCIAYFGVSDDCAEFYDDKFPDLRKMLLANVVLFFIYQGISLILVCNGALKPTSAKPIDSSIGVSLAV